MTDVYCTFSLSTAKTLVRILNHNIENADRTGASAYGIDTVCRADCVGRWREIRDYIAGQVAVAEKTKEKAK